MAPKKTAASKKRARSRSRPRSCPATAAAIPADISRDVSPRDLKKIKRAIASASNLEDVASIQDVLRTKLELNYIAENDILRCISNEDDDDDDDNEMKIQNLLALVIGAWVQKQKADKVFEMLDEAGKGVVVVEDLQLVAAEYLSEDIKNESDLVDMIQEVDQSGDGILTKDDFYRIASQIQL